MTPAVAQAAAWHVGNGMSWDDLARKTFDQAAAADTPYFSREQLVAAMQLVAASRALGRGAIRRRIRAIQSGDDLGRQSGARRRRSLEEG